jgi:hypothetical protein
MRHVRAPVSFSAQRRPVHHEIVYQKFKSSIIVEQRGGLSGGIRAFPFSNQRSLWLAGTRDGEKHERDKNNAVAAHKLLVTS